MSYYTQDAQGCILAFADWLFEENALKTDRAIVYGHDGQLYFSGEEPLLPLNEARSAQLAELDAAFHQAEAVGWLQSSLGFPIDANERANRDTDGLITLMEATGTASTFFCDRDNVMREVALAGMRTIRLEIIAYGQQLYAKKWALRERINTAVDIDELMSITISME